MIRFSITGFSAWSPGLETREDWQAWAQNPLLPPLKAEPALKSMPPLLRRRADFHGKMALEAAYCCLPEDTDIPVVFCSRHGEVSRASKMLKTQAETREVSPTAFSLSVHNAVAGLFSIARHAHAPATALAARADGVENAMIESCGLLMDGASSVLLVVSNNTLPADYSPYSDGTDLPYAWAWRVAPPTPENAFSLSWSAADKTPKAPDALPPELALLRFYLLNNATYSRATRQTAWHWQRDA